MTLRFLIFQHTVRGEGPMGQQGPHCQHIMRRKRPDLPNDAGRCGPVSGHTVPLVYNTSFRIAKLMREAWWRSRYGMSYVSAKRSHFTARRRQLHSFVPRSITRSIAPWYRMIQSRCFLASRCRGGGALDCDGAHTDRRSVIIHRGGLAVRGGTPAASEFPSRLVRTRYRDCVHQL